MNQKEWYEVVIDGRYGDESRAIRREVYARSGRDAVAKAVGLEFDVLPHAVNWDYLDDIAGQYVVFLIGNDGRYVTEAKTLDELARVIPDPASRARLEAAAELPLLTPRHAPHFPDGYQSQCLATWGSADRPLRDQRLHAALGLAGETGEVSEVLKKHFFKPGGMVEAAAVVDELADVAYYLAVNAHLWGYTIDDLFLHLAGKLAGGHGWTAAQPGGES